MRFPSVAATSPVAFFRFPARRAALLAVVLLGLTAGCGDRTGAPGSKGEAKAGSSGSKGDGKAAKGGGGPVPVVMAPVARQPMPLRLHAIGNVEAMATVGIKSRVDGQILSTAIGDGQDVKKGQPLFQIDARPFEAQLRQLEANLLRDKAQSDRAKAQEARYRDLLAKNFVSQDAYAQYVTNVQTAEAVVRAGEAAIENARLQVEYASIRSPIDGRAGKVLIQTGNMVKANDTPAMVVINQLSPIYVSFTVPEQHLGSVRTAMKAGRLRVDAQPTESGSAASTGTLAFFDNTVDTTTGTVRLRATFPNADRTLWPGQFATVTLTLGEQAEAIVVASQTVQTGPKGQFVYVVNAESTADLRPVVVDRVDGPLTVIAKGLSGGEQVVTSGQSRLFPGAKVRPAGERADKGGKDGEKGGTKGPEQAGAGTGDKASPAADAPKGGAR